MSALGATDAELSVVLTDDESIRELNAKHRRKRKATDVLAFPMDTHGAGPSRKVRLFGDVVISLDTAERQARERRHPLIAEVTHLLAHGILHLAGYALAARLVATASGRASGAEPLLQRLRNNR